MLQPQKPLPVPPHPQVDDVAELVVWDPTRNEIAGVNILTRLLTGGILVLATMIIIEPRKTRILKRRTNQFKITPRRVKRDAKTVTINSGQEMATVRRRAVIPTLSIDINPLHHLILPRQHHHLTPTHLKTNVNAGIPRKPLQKHPTKILITPY